MGEVALSVIRQYVAPIAAGVLLYTVVEYVVPKSSPAVASRLRGLAFWIFYLGCAVAVLTAYGAIWTNVRWQAPFRVDLRGLWISSSTPAVLVGAVVSWWLASQVVEFFYYWFHRMQHGLPALWRFHAIHHSIEDLNALNSNHHPSEELLRLVFVILPVSMLFKFTDGYTPWIVALLLGTHRIYLHSSTRIHFGWGRYLLPDNRFHRIHHSVEPQHLNKNFGAGSGLWDVVFGTAWFPRKAEWPDVGLAGVSEPKTLNDFIIRPFNSTLEG